MIVLFLASFVLLPEKDLYQYQGSTSKKISGKRKTKKKSSIEKNLKIIMERDKKIMELLKRQEDSLIIRKKSDKIIALTRLKGMVLNSVIASNLTPTKFVVRIDEGGDVEGELGCVAHAFERRILGHCNLLVMDEEEFKVDISIWGLDGAEGVIADKIYSGEEATFISSSFAAFLQGVLDASKDRIMTPFGETTRSNAKNKISGGLLNIADNVKNRIIESGNKVIKMNFINSGKRVVLFFNKTLDLIKEK